jgi:hypothetical protein
MKLFFLTFFVTVVAMGPAGFAGATGCRHDANDPFEPSGIMPTGKNARQCIRIDLRRSFRILSREEAAAALDLSGIPIEEKTIYIANISHDGRFWTAVIPSPDDIEKMEFLLERYFPKHWVGHPMLDFKARPGREYYLIPQSGGGTNERLSDLVIALEPVGTAKAWVEGNLLDAYEERYVIGHRLLSLEDERNFTIVHQKHQVQRFEIKLSPPQVGRLFVNLTLVANDP